MAHASLLNRYVLGDMEIAYLRDNGGHVGLRLLPACALDISSDGAAFSEPLVQLHIRGDFLAGSAVNGHTLSDTVSTWRFLYRTQTLETEGDRTTIRTVRRIAAVAA